MITEELKHIKLASDSDFLEYATHLRFYKFSKADSEILYNEIEKRLAGLGYILEFGCCGRNKLHKKETNK